MPVSLNTFPLVSNDISERWCPEAESRRTSQSEARVKASANQEFSAGVFCNLQVEFRALAIDQNISSVKHLLAGAIKAIEAAHRSEGQEELHCLGAFRPGHLDGGTKTDAVKIGVRGEK